MKGLGLLREELLMLGIFICFLFYLFLIFLIFYFFKKAYKADSNTDKAKNILIGIVLLICFVVVNYFLFKKNP